MSSSRPELLVDWCSYEAAKYAVMHWHYSKAMPVGKLVKIGAWENGRYIGCVLFSNGSSRFLGTRYGLDMLDVTELARVALGGHQSFTSQIVARAVRMVRVHCPELRLVVSFADPEVGHLGTLYQATNWIYVGRASADASVRRYRGPDGRVWQWRSLARWLNSRKLPSTVVEAKNRGWIPFESEPKHKYLYPLDRVMRRQIEPLAQPYPKRDHASEAK